MVRESPGSKGVGPTIDGDEPRDVISLTVPGGGRFVGVARMVVGGLASRLDLSYERLDDLQLAVETVLGEYAAGDNVSVELIVRDRAVEVFLSPVDEARILAELDGDPEALGLGVLLSQIVDAISFEDRDGARWLRLTKQAPISPTE
jgi:anti-sigma regulatory factor (Ser/Thr protein kinase)